MSGEESHATALRGMIAWDVCTRDTYSQIYQLDYPIKIT